MQITFTIKDSDMKNALSYRLDEDIYEQFNDEVLKRAGVPAYKVMIEQLFQDEKFMKKLTQEVIKRTDILDVVYEILWDVQSKTIDKLVKTCEDEQAKWQVEKHAREEQGFNARKEEIKRHELEKAINLLENSGYTVTHDYE